VEGADRFIGRQRELHPYPPTESVMFIAARRFDIGRQKPRFGVHARHVLEESGRLRAAKRPRPSNGSLRRLRAPGEGIARE
jgi:hypothetical protein